MTLDAEQEFVLKNTLGVQRDGRWAALRVGLNVPRQNGKGEVLLARELFGLFELGERLVVHSAHEFKTSARHFVRLEQVVRSSDELMARVKRAESGRVIGFRYGNGDEALELESGEKIEFRTRTKSGLRGFDDVALLVLDEDMILPDAAHGSMFPTVRASRAPRGPQIWYTGSAVDQTIHEHGVVAARVRESGIAGEDGLAYFEWSLDYANPEVVPLEVLTDPAAWRAVNFAIARGRVLEEHMALEFSSMSHRTFAVELLGVGDWPPTQQGAGFQVISAEDWKSLLDPASKIDSDLVVAFEVTPSRSHASICAAGRRADGLGHIELIDRQPGTAWLPGRLAELTSRHRPLAVVCDSVSPAASLVPEVEQTGIEVKQLNTSEFAEACGVFFDAVEPRGFRHLGQPDLDSQVKGAEKRKLGDRWAWDRKAGDATALIACTLAYGMVVTIQRQHLWAGSW